MKWYDIKTTPPPYEKRIVVLCADGTITNTWRPFCSKYDRLLILGREYDSPITHWAEIMSPHWQGYTHSKGTPWERDIPHAENNDWVSVDDRLPPDGERVIIWREKTGYDFESLEDRQWHTDDFLDKMLGKITHWMNIPDAEQGAQ